MNEKRIDNLPTWVKGLLGVLGAIDVALRVFAVIDLMRRDDDEVNGPKKAWLPALVSISTMGLLPTAYFALGRRDDA